MHFNFSECELRNDSEKVGYFCVQVWDVIDPLYLAHLAHSYTSPILAALSINTMARAGPSSSSASGSKPYDRPSYQLKVRGTKANPTSALDTSGSKTQRAKSASEITASSSKAISSGDVNVGAPAQLGQISRKGKKAWRKNIDVREIEKGMEEMREEERVTG